jgi:hypothetical protein
LNEDVELAALASEAWELRNSAYLVDAAEAIATWHERRHLRELERRQEANGRLVAVLRETDPQRIPRRASA